MTLIKVNMLQSYYSKKKYNLRLEFFKYIDVIKYFVNKISPETGVPIITRYFEDIYENYNLLKISQNIRTMLDKRWDKR
jgi:hypothetical protein